jgi:hypothetical protein
MPSTPRKTTAAKKAAATRAPAAGDNTGDSEAPAPKRSSVHVGQLVEHTYTDLPSGTEVTQRGIVTGISDDGATVAPLPDVAVIPLDQLTAL